MRNRATWLPFVLLFLIFFFSSLTGHSVSMQAAAQVESVRQPLHRELSLLPAQRSNAPKLLARQAVSESWYKQTIVPYRVYEARGFSSKHSTRMRVRPLIVYHEVQAGDTLWQLAINDHSTVQHLMKINHLQSTMLYPGERLRIYEGGRAVWDKLLYARLQRTGLPLSLLPVYQEAGSKFSVPWTILAAIHRIETNFSMGAEVSSAGAEGPMQFLPSTFAHYGVAAPGQTGLPQIDNVYDAIYSCANMLHQDGYSRNPVQAIYLYNHSMQYVDTVQQFAQSF